jgi:hypothetical protein
MSLDLSRLVNLKTTPTGWIAACPECQRNGRDLKGQNHLSILRDGRFNCAVGSKEDASHNRNIRALIRGQGAVTDIEYIDPEPRLTVEKTYPESALLGLLPDYAYWLGRGMREDVLKALENGIAPKDTKGKLSGRSVFPIRNLKGQIMGFSGRLTEENSFAPNWKHLFRSGQAVYPAHLTGGEIKRTRTAVLNESLGDTLGLLTHDVKPVLCTWGLNLSGAIISYLVAANVKRVFCAPNRDADPRKGQAAAERWAKKLEPFIPEVVIRLPGEPFSDWGDCAAGGEAGAAELARFRAEVEA